EQAQPGGQWADAGTDEENEPVQGHSAGTVRGGGFAEQGDHRGDREPGDPCRPEATRQEPDEQGGEHARQADQPEPDHHRGIHAEAVPGVSTTSAVATSTTTAPVDPGYSATGDRARPRLALLRLFPADVDMEPSITNVCVGPDGSSVRLK